MTKLQKLSGISKQVTLKSIVETRSGGTPSRTNPDYWGDYLPWVTAKDLKTFYLEDSLEKISFKAVEKGVPLAKNNEVLILVRGMGLMKDVPIGVAKCQMSFGQDIKVLVPKEGIDGEYLAHFLVAARPQLMDMVTLSGHGTGRIETEKLLSLKVWLPTLQVQKRIIDSLTIWNNAIATTEKLITAKRRLKQGLMQKLLTGKFRITGFKDKPWRSVKLGEVFSERIERAREDLPLLSVTGSMGLIYRDELIRRDTSNSDKSNYKRVASGDIVYNTMRMWQGVSALVNIEGIVSPAYTVVIPNSSLNASFIKHFFKFSNLIHSFHRYSQGLVSDTLTLKFQQFSRIKVNLPQINEQKKIAEILDCLDQEILHLEAKLKLFQTQKQGLMQQLLTGKIRIQTP